MYSCFCHEFGYCARPLSCIYVGIEEKNKHANEFYNKTSKCEQNRYIFHKILTTIRSKLISKYYSLNSKVLPSFCLLNFIFLCVCDTFLFIVCSDGQLVYISVSTYHWYAQCSTMVKGYLV